VKGDAAMKIMSLIAVTTVFAAFVLPAGAASVSTNPDTPTSLKVNTIVGQMLQGDGKSFDNYYTFKAGPGTVKVRVTLRAGTDAGDVEVALTDPDGNKMAPASCPGNCNYNNVIASGQGDAISTATFQFDANKTVTMHVHGSAQYYHSGPKPTYRITLDGDVSLDKTASPLKIANR
jgi:hypothetical protein